MFLEWEDEKIIDYVKTYCLREFSYYFPEIRRMNLNVQLESNQVTGRSNEYYLVEPEGREILNVIDVYFSESDWLIHGHPPLGPFTVGDVKQWAIDVSNAGMVKQFSSWDKTHEFIHPNILRISPVPTDVMNATVEYERMQSPDFRGIQNDLHHFFLEMCLADVMISIGRIRKRYGAGNLRTPFGEIPLESDIYDQGMEKKRELVEKMTVGSFPNIVIDHG